MYYQAYQRKPRTKRWITIGHAVFFFFGLLYYSHEFFIEESTGTQSILYERLAADCEFHLFFHPHNGNLHRERGRYLAKEAYVTFTSTHPQKHQALMRESVREFVKAIETNPNDAEAYFALSNLCYGRLDEYIAAASYNKKYLPVNPASSQYQDILAKSHRYISIAKVVGTAEQ